MPFKFGTDDESALTDLLKNIDIQTVRRKLRQFGFMAHTTNLQEWDAFTRINPFDDNSTECIFVTGNSDPHLIWMRKDSGNPAFIRYNGTVGSPREWLYVTHLLGWKLKAA